MGDRAQPRTDLYQCIAGFRIDQVDHPGDGIWVDEKVLPEAFSSAVSGHERALRAARSARSMAVLKAAARLPDSAWPVPASSSAVPWSTEVRTMGSPRVMFTAFPNPAYLSTGKP